MCLMCCCSLFLLFYASVSIVVSVVGVGVQSER